ncbi:MAG: sugar phosphate isomerase/epimerase family protein [Armatimonadota bacterium]
MRKGINYWSFPGGLEGKKDFAAAVKEAKDLGFQGIEVCLFTDGPLSLEMSDSDVAKLKRTLDSAGLEAASVTCGALWENQLTSSDPKKREAGKHIVTRCLEVAGKLGATGILVVPGSVETFFMPEGEIVQYDVALQRVEEAVKSLAPVAEENKVAIGIENVWNKLFMSPVEARDFVDRIGSEYVGWFFDVGNILALGFPEQWITILGKRIKKVHLKDYRKSVGTINGFVDLLEGDVNWPGVMKALKAVGYNDYLIAEMIPGYAFAPETRLANTSLAMDKIMAM